MRDSAAKERVKGLSFPGTKVPVTLLPRETLALYLDVSGSDLAHAAAFS